MSNMTGQKPAKLILYSAVSLKYSFYYRPMNG